MEDMEDIENIDNETLVEEQPIKEWLIPLIDNIKRLKEENTKISFQIIDIKEIGFLVKVEGLYALISFRYMLWRYNHLYWWKLIFPSLLGKSFAGYIQNVTKSTSRVYIRADTSQFENVIFPFEKDETYTAIVLQKTVYTLLIDLGYAFGWQYGSLLFEIICLNEDENVDLFPLYNEGDEFNAVYVGKSIIGNDIFRYEDNRYFSKEHNLVGLKTWATLNHTKSGSHYLKINEQYFGQLLLDEEKDYGVSYELLQKTLQTMPDGQHLWCKIIGVTHSGIMQLKWLIGKKIPIEYTLSLYRDFTVLNMDDPDLEEDKKALIGKIVWCEVIGSSYPKTFKIGNHYVGIISMYAAHYQDVPLNLIINELSEISADQQILCKVKGIDLNGKLQLQWIVKWDARAKKLVFPNKFSQKIDIEELNIRRWNSPMWQKCGEKFIKKYFSIPDKKKQENTIIDDDIKVGDKLWLEAKRSDKNELYFLISDKYFGRIIPGRTNYSKTSRTAVKKLLRNIPEGQSLFCLIQRVLSNFRVELRWEIEEDPYAKILFSNKQEDTIIEDDIENKPQIGDKLWLEAKRDINDKLFFQITNKYIGKIMIDKANYPIKSFRGYLRSALRSISEGQILLCSVRGFSGFRVELRWEVEEDPYAKQFQFFSRTSNSSLSDSDKMLLMKMLGEIQKREERLIILPEVKKEEKKETPIIEKQEDATPLPKEKEREIIKADISHLKELKVVGKIDLDAINPKLKPKKKSRKELEERIRIEKEKREALKIARRKAFKDARKTPPSTPVSEPLRADVQ